MKRNKKGDKRSYILSKETLGLTIMLFCGLITVMLLTYDFIFGGLGSAICHFMYGTFGYGSYFVMFLLAYLGEWLTFGKTIKMNRKAAACVSLAVIMLFMLFHAVSTEYIPVEAGYGDYLTECFDCAANGYSGYTAGGVVCGLLVYPVANGITYVGAYVLFSLLTVAFCVLSFFIFRSLYRRRAIAQGAKHQGADGFDDEMQDEVFENGIDNLYSVNDEHEIVSSATQERQAERPANAVTAEGDDKGENVDDKYSSENLGRKILFEPGEFAAESYRRNMIYNENSYFNHPVQNDGDYMSSFSDGTPKPKNQTPSAESTYTSDYSSQVVNGNGGMSDKPSYLYGDSPATSLDGNPASNNAESNGSSYTVNGSISHYNSQPVQSGLEQRDGYGVQPPVQREEPPAYSQPTYSAPIPERPRENDIFSRPVENYVQPTPEVDDLSDDVFSEQVQETEQPDFNEPENVEPEQPEPPRQRESGLFNLFSSSNPRLNEQPARVEPDVSALNNMRAERGGRENIFDDDNDNIFGDQTPLVDRTQNDTGTRMGGDSFAPERGEVGFSARSERTERLEQPYERPSVQPIMPTPVRNAEVKPVVEERPAEPEKPKHVWKKYIRPSLELLDDYPENNNVNTGEIEESKRIIVETLGSFRIISQVSNVVVGPAITRYDVIIEDKTNIKNALKYREAVAMALMKENVNAYLNYSRGAISFEIPNSSRTVVGLKGMLASSQFINAKPNSLAFALGKNVEGTVVCPDITKMPHLLVAGTTGSGKSICLSALIISLLYKYGPEELRFILVDPKQVEFISYDKLPHLMINEIIYDVDKAIKALNWAIKEMERRYQLFKEMTEKGVATKNLTEYNQHLPEGEEKLPKIVVILDEFGDLMLQAKKDIESRIIRLVQKSRACGIHLILATQRPSVDCITGLIKSNLPTRIGFKVNSFDDARTIFDIGGAEKLLGKGDMYFRSADNPELARIQGCFIDTHEVQRVTDFIKQNNETYFDQSVSDFINTVEEEQGEAPAADDGGASGDGRVDDTFIKALKFCVTSNQASVSMIQRRFPIGYMKACKIIDWMETMNYITQSEGSKPRKVILSREEFIQKYGDVDD